MPVVVFRRRALFQEGVNPEVLPMPTATCEKLVFSEGNLGRYSPENFP